MGILASGDIMMDCKHNFKIWFDIFGFGDYVCKKCGKIKGRNEYVGIMCDMDWTVRTVSR